MTEDTDDEIEINKGVREQVGTGVTGFMTGRERDSVRVRESDT